MFSQMPALHTFDTISNVFKVMVIAVLGVWFVYFYQKVSLFFVGIVFFEVCIFGWEELELEVVRDADNNKITVCFID